MKFLLSHKIVSVTLSFLILFSTLSLTIEKHFCGDTLIDVAIFSEADKCEMEAYEIELAKITKKNCCKDEVDIVDGLGQITTNTNEYLKSLKKQFIQAYALSYIGLFEELQDKVIPYATYESPNLIIDIHVLNETYLI